MQSAGGRAATECGGLLPNVTLPSRKGEAIQNDHRHLDKSVLPRLSH